MTEFAIGFANGVGWVIAFFLGIILLPIIGMIIVSIMGADKDISIATAIIIFILYWIGVTIFLISL
ncbi:MAG: hypothetical protein Q7R56_01765 [Nanoarchaeota archaeon]|nr:hypothetical protein [Nanoarchaeota archaeon]